VGRVVVPAIKVQPLELEHLDKGLTVELADRVKGLVVVTMVLTLAVVVALDRLAETQLPLRVVTAGTGWRRQFPARRWHEEAVVAVEQTDSDVRPILRVELGEAGTAEYQEMHKAERQTLAVVVVVWMQHLLVLVVPVLWLSDTQTLLRRQPWRVTRNWSQRGETLFTSLRVPAQ
jgi:hypothetical protein